MGYKIDNDILNSEIDFNNKMKELGFEIILEEENEEKEKLELEKEN